MTMALLSLTGCDYAYRYECQDPENFNKADCKPPLCEYEGQCSGWLVGQKTAVPVAEEAPTMPEDVQDVAADAQQEAIDEVQEEDTHE